MKRVLAFLLALVMALGMTACGAKTEPAVDAPAAAAPDAAPGSAPAAPAAPAVPGEPVYGGTANIYYQNFNTVFDPAMGESYTYSLWLESLWGPDWGLNDPSQFNFDANVLPFEDIAGQIADTWSFEPHGDGTADLKVTIRNDVYFQQKDAQYDVFGGRNLTAADVAYSYDRLWGTGTCQGKDPVVYESSWINTFSSLVDFTLTDPVEVTGDYELVFHLNTESEAQLATFMNTRVNITGVEWDTLSEEQRGDWHYACGTGPYILSDYQAGSFYKFVRNDNYYDHDERHPENQLPYLDGITLTSATDAAAIQAAFIAGNLDYISMDANLTPDQNQQIIDAMGGDVHVLNYDSNAAGISLKVNQSPFDDIRVRIAMQKAINLEEVNSAYYGYDTDLNYAALWIAAMNSWSAVPDWDAELLSEYTYDPEGAKALLTEAGYPNGFTFTVALDTNADQDLYRLIQTYFAAVGITMDIEIMPDMQAAHQVSGASDDPRVVNQNLADLEAIDSAIFMYSDDGMANSNYHHDQTFNDMLYAASDEMSAAGQAEKAKALDQYFSEQHWLIACSGTTVKNELLSSRIGGLENGERISFRYFTKTFLARIWAEDAA